MLFSLKRRIKFFYQRLTRGWDDSDTWSMDGTFARMIVPRLERFNDLKVCHPVDLTMEEWTTIIDEMIAGFKFYASEDARFEAVGDEFDRAQVGIDLFAKWYPHLWW